MAMATRSAEAHPEATWMGRLLESATDDYSRNGDDDVTDDNSGFKGTRARESAVPGARL